VVGHAHGVAAVAGAADAAGAAAVVGAADAAALIRGTNGQSNGIVPFLRTLDSSIAAVNQGGRRKGAACVYLEPWHPDIEEFLELRDNTSEIWSLIDPDEVPELPDLWGEEFDAAYRAAEADGRYVRQVSARGPVRRGPARPGRGRAAAG